jgi:hypothetical protein
MNKLAGAITWNERQLEARENGFESPTDYDAWCEELQAEGSAVVQVRPAAAIARSSKPQAAPVVPDARSPGDALIDALAGPLAEKVGMIVAALVARPRYYTAGTAPIERRAWNRAVREIPVFKPGRELLVRSDDLHAWIERQGRVLRDETDPLSYEAFAASVRGRPSAPQRPAS